MATTATETTKVMLQQWVQQQPLPYFLIMVRKSQACHLQPKDILHVNNRWQHDGSKITSSRGVTIAKILTQLYKQKQLSQHVKDDHSFTSGSLNLLFVDRADRNNYPCALEI